MIIGDGLESYILALCSKFSIPINSINDLATIQLAEIFYRELRDDKVGSCLTCGKVTKFGGFKTGWNRFCSTSCQMNDPKQLELRQQDALERFGVKSYVLTVKGCLNSKDTKNTEAYKIAFKQALRKRWDTHKDQIVSKMRETKLKNGKKYWPVRFKHHLDRLNELGFTVVESYATGKPKLLKHTFCEMIQPYGRWSSKSTYLCHKCSPNTRIKSETAFFDELEQSLKIKFQRNVCIDGIKVDGIYGNIAIDFNGLFWHSAAAEHAGFGEFDPNYHRVRWKFLNDRNIKFIQVFEDEWCAKREIVLSRLKHVFGIADRRLMARKCTINQISSRTASDFLSVHHLAGHVPCSVALACEHAGEIVAVATFGKTRFGNRKNVELLRFASTCSISGGLSKIMKYAASVFRGQDIISYSDNFWGDGSGYKAAGFELLAEIPAGYFYYDKKNGNRVARQALRKDQYEKVFGLQYDMNKSEVDNAVEVSCFRIFDAGKNKWILKNN